MFDNMYQRAKETMLFPEDNITWNGKFYVNPVMEIAQVLYQRYDALSDSEIFEMFKSRYDEILSDMSSGISSGKPSILAPLFMKKRIVSIFISVTRDQIQCNRFNESNAIICNKIAYSYLTKTSKKANEDDKVIKDMYFNLSRIVNGSAISRLKIMGMSDEICAYLALCRHSSNDAQTNAKRLNVAMISFAKLFNFSEENVIKIYQILFDEFTSLFKAIMFDPYDKNISDEGSIVYSNISLAALDILNAMAPQNIYSVLSRYVSEYQYCNYGDADIRFSMNCISSDYTNIWIAINALQQRGVYVP